jgi:hypothetical protein
VLFGGWGRDGQRSDTWLWDGRVWSWSEVAAAGPAARSVHDMSYDVARDRVVLYGGIDSDGNRLDDT